MRIAIVRQGDNIVCVRELDDIKDSGEIAHMITELEITKQQLLDLWEEWPEEQAS